MYRWMIGLVIGALLLGVGIGCGGGSDETDSTVTKVQFVKKADFICAEFKAKRLAAAEKEYNPKQRQGSHSVGSKATEELEAELKVQAEELLTDKLLPLTREEQEQLEALGTPAGDEENVEKMFANFDQALGEIEEEGFEGLVGGNQFDAFESEAEKYGLNCKVI